MVSRRDFLSTTSLAITGLLAGCAHGSGVQLPPWAIHSLGHEHRHALELIMLEEDDHHSNRGHKEEIEDHLVSIYSQHPERDTYYAATGIYLTDGIVLTVDHAVRDTFLADPDRQHVIEYRRRQRQIVSVLAWHPGYDLALLKLEDEHFLDRIHLHMGNPYQGMPVDVIAYQNNSVWQEHTSVLSNSDIAITTEGNRHIDMFRIRRNFGYGWSGAVVISRTRGHLIGLVSSSPVAPHHGYSSCSRAMRIRDI